MQRARFLIRAAAAIASLVVAAHAGATPGDEPTRDDERLSAAIARVERRWSAACALLATACGSALPLLRAASSALPRPPPRRPKTWPASSSAALHWPRRPSAPPEKAGAATRAAAGPTET
ncbi:MAG: hypothetical protein U1F67_13875 [Rubrivivax sp.]